MPFTPTHVAAVLPGLPWLRGRELPVSALVIGSMIPDAGVFLPGVIDYWATHSVRGLFTLCLPLGLAAFCGWEYFAKGPLIDLAPQWARVRANGPRGTAVPPLTPRTLLWAAGLIVVGAASHVLWDSFTHVGRWGVAAFPVLDEVWFTLPDWLPLRDHRVRGYRFGQYGSTLALLPVVGLYAAARLRRRDPTGDPRTAVPRRVRRATLGAFVLLPAVAAGRDVAITWGRAPLRTVAARAVIAAGVALLIAVVAYAAGHAALASRRRAPRSADGPAADGS